MASILSTSRPPSSRRRTALTSTVGLKITMAVSGLAFIAFVLGHMYGNLKAFQGHDAYNAYAEHLRVLGEPLFPRTGLLWLMRVGLIAALVVHVTVAVVLWRRAARARTTQYAARLRRTSTFASRTMRWGGLTIFAFLVWHLANFSIGKVNVTGAPTNDPYDLLLDTFQVWWMTAIYLVAMATLALHLWHGTWSSAQTLGLTGTPRRRFAARATGAALAVVVAGGFSLSPIFIAVGVIR